MRIAHIVCSYPPYYGGMGNVVFQTAEELGKRGVTVEVFTPGIFESSEIRPSDAPQSPHHAPELAKLQHTVHRLTPSIQYGNAARLPTLEQELDSFDIVHLHYPFFGTANIAKKWKKKNPHKTLVITYHMDARGTGWKGLFFSLYARYVMPKILQSADALIASSFDYIEASEARHVYANNPQKWHEIPFGVDTNRFSPNENPAALAQQIGISPSIPTILFVGGMDPAHYFKGVSTLLQAIFLLKKQNIPVQAVLVGGGSLQQQYMLQAKGLGIHDRVHFVGKVGDAILPSYYRLADLLVLPSIHAGEAFGMVLLEAFASGVPVIASDLPGVRTVAKKAGVTVPPKQPSLLAQAIAEYIQLPKEVHTLQKSHARDVAERIYSWRAIGDELMNVYSDAMKRS
ncbi:MAG: glycosyltransferase family 4 protein [Candidatus Magasanikbacteria bacterium]|nr:glycosyltransferase family 4 protein [Candidatus Magasanikbacteria bacterium]